jgi:FixJ family two-component response regulator
MSHEQTIFVIDDEPDVRAALNMLIKSVGLKPEIYESPASYLDAYDPSRPGCLVLDMRMPGMSGLELQDRLRRSVNHMPVIIVTGHGDVPITVRAMKAGAYEFLQKPFNDQDLIDAIQGALAEYSVIWQKEDEQKQLAANLAGLTPREKEVLQHLGLGKPNKVIAYDMGLSVRTVEGYRASIMNKLNVRTIGELMQIVLEAGINAREGN